MRQDRSESVRERKIAPYKSDHQQHGARKVRVGAAVLLLWHLTVLCTASPVNRYRQKSASKLRIKPTGLSKRKSVMLGFCFSLFYLLDYLFYSLLLVGLPVLISSTCWTTCFTLFYLLHYLFYSLLPAGLPVLLSSTCWTTCFTLFYLLNYLFYSLLPVGLPVLVFSTCWVTCSSLFYLLGYLF